MRRQMRFSLLGLLSGIAVAQCYTTKTEYAVGGSITACVVPCGPSTYACPAARPTSGGAGARMPAKSAADMTAERHGNAQQLSNDAALAIRDSNFARADGLLKKAHKLWPENVTIWNTYQGVESTLYNEKLNRPLNQSMNAAAAKLETRQQTATVNTQGLEFGSTEEQGTALRQLLGSSMGEANAACIIDGQKDCVQPVTRIVVRKGEAPLPADVVEFEARIPKSEQAKPVVQGWMKQYEHFAKIRSDAQEVLVKDAVDAKASPNDQDLKTKVIADVGRYNGAKKDEDGTKKALIDMGIPLLAPPAGGAAGNARP